ncbi:McrC family protein [Clostridium sp. LIBA-8841]|uniref:McrC family protein n=1 Tax=Clostridium sp. LIBA-8841 TaxID=2987530 RepID=UPI002AC57029|nr:McrC family protein [Clostridium sp. LIBA-8841]MDZ5253785.1 McrC family protein [Clostridium sp. LIBA-8841]
MRHIVVQECYESLRIVDDFINIRSKKEDLKRTKEFKEEVEARDLGEKVSNNFDVYLKEDFQEEPLKGEDDFSKRKEFFQKEKDLEEDIKEEIKEETVLYEESFEKENGFHEYEEGTFYDEYNYEKVISKKESDELYNYVLSEKLNKDNIIWGKDTIRFINYVGYIRLSTVSIEILPKISINKNNPDFERKSLLNMLSKCGILKINYSEISSLRLYKQSLNEILAYLFSKKLQRELSKGIYLEYVNIEENRNSLKGSLLFNEQIKNMASCTPKAFCKYEEFSKDNKLNRIFSYFIKSLIREIKNKETLKLLKFSQSILGDVDERNITLNDVKNYRFNRLNERFEEAFTLGKMLVLGESSLGTLGDSKAYSILFKMNEVFELYIGKLLGKLIQEETLHMQHSKYKLLINEETNKGVFKLIPDIVIEKNGEESIILDTKWKRISSSYNRHGVKREDLYQMYAYLTRYKNVSTVILLYPYNEKIEGEEGEYLESWYLDEEKNKKVRVYAVNLESEMDTLESLDKIVKKYILK